MSKSSTFERPWGYHGSFVMGKPPGQPKFNEGCNCYACNANRIAAGLKQNTFKAPVPKSKKKRSANNELELWMKKSK